MFEKWAIKGKKPCIHNLVNAPTKKNSLTASSKCVKKQFYKERKKIRKETKQTGKKELEKVFKVSKRWRSRVRFFTTQVSRKY